MGYFDNKKNVLEYIEIAKSYDGRDLIKVLKKYAKPGSHILEIGMGPGKDLDILQKNFTVTGSDNSQVFLDLYKKKHMNADLLFLNAITMNTTRKFG